ncbi:hypothetical protein AG4045_002535 [Apium graveolens]|uniref:Uncharacterized protein n=1 Tax=Apium graveolens TaxID=4045 RepID=A0A6L5B7P2_APIGR|nr:hypothetical protein AG4045_002535 [Apium graveolens]
MKQQQQDLLGDEKLPLKLIKSDAIPPCPSGSESCIDWLPDFSGYSWLAYASSSLLVISHLPIATCSIPAPGGPIFRQVFELGGGVVSAVSWSPVIPSPGVLAASFLGFFYSPFRIYRSTPLGGLLLVMASFLSESKSYCGEETIILLPGKFPGSLRPTGLRILFLLRGPFKTIINLMELASVNGVIGFGPHRMVTLWAIHCLDDVTPMRYPRVTLWKRT